MGQYFKAVLVNGNNVEVHDSWSYNNGAKQVEHCYRGNDYTEAVMERIRKLGPTRLVWMGDYADEVLDEMIEKSRNDEERECHNNFLKTLYRIAWRSYLKVGSTIESPFKMYTPIDNWETNRKKYYVCNNDKSEYVVISEYVSSDECVVHPVPLLCSVRGGGGGDYHGMDEDLLGRWAGDVLTITTRKPPMKELKTNFMVKW